MSKGWADLANAVTASAASPSPVLAAMDGVVLRQHTLSADLSSLPAVAGAVRLIASTIDQLPVTVTRGQVPEWLRRPRQFGSAFDLGDLVQHLVDGMVTRGYGALRCTRVGGSWRLDALHPHSVQTVISSGGVVRVSYTLDGQPIRQVPWSPADTVDGQSYLLPIPYRVSTKHPQGTSPLLDTSTSLAGHVATEQHASSLFTGGGAHTGPILSTDQDLTKATAERYKQAWIQARREGGPAVIGSGLKYHNEVPNPGDLQLVEARAFNQAAVYMLLGIPPSYMGAALVGGQSSLSYSNAKDNKRLFRQSCLAAFTTQIEDALSTLLPNGRNPDEETRVRFDWTEWEGTEDDAEADV